MILVVWASTFVRRFVVVVNSRPAPGFTLVDFADFDSGMAVLVHNAWLPWSNGVYTSAPFQQTHEFRAYLLGDFWLVPATPTAPVQWGLTLPATLWIGIGSTLLALSFRRRHPKDHCPKCGYDLTGIADKCPECGRTITPVKNA